ncbi:MAG: YitT family protein [Phascolarctobacterium sp.]|nr:YitT family protein [Candidatus Phascolarctobacterium caballi]
MKYINKDVIYKLIVLTVGSLLMALATNWFYVPSHLLNGGTSGFGMLIYYITGIPIGIATIACNIPIFAYAYFKVSKTYVAYATFTMIIFSVLTDYFAFLQPPLQEMLLNCLAGGVLCGIGSALIYRMDSSSGGGDIICTLVNRKFAIPMATTGFLINLVILILGSFVTGLEPVIYTAIAFFVSAKVCNAFVIGFDFKKNIMIISDHADEIAEAIIKIVGRGVTFFYGEGAYTHQHRKVVMCIARLTQTAEIRRIVKGIDPQAFMTMHDINDVYGKGFTLQADIRPKKEISPGNNNE